MKVLNNGYFSLEFTTEDLKLGLRRTAKAPRNSKLLTVCNGAVGKDGVLRTLDALTIHSAISAAVTAGDIIEDDFPFPQVFVTQRHVIVCNRTSILEFRGIAFTEVISGLTTGSKWNIAASYDFVYLSNGETAVTRSAQSGVYSVSSSAPVNNAACNYNGQFFIGPA